MADLPGKNLIFCAEYYRFCLDFVHDFRTTSDAMMISNPV